MLAPGAADNCRVTLDVSKCLSFVVGSDCRAGSSAQLKYRGKMQYVLEVELVLVSAEKCFFAIGKNLGGVALENSGPWTCCLLVWLGWLQRMLSYQPV